MVSVQNILQSFKIDIIMILAPITIMVYDKRSNPISSIVSFLKDILNSHYDGKAEEIPDIMED